MNRTEALSALRRHADAVRRMGATSLYLFGSTVRDEARPGSDVDVFIDYDPLQSFSLFNLAGIKLFLEEELHAEVDVTTRDSLHPMLKAEIETTAVRVF